MNMRFIYDTSFPVNDSISTNDIQEIPFPLSRIIRYTDELIIFTCNYSKIDEQLKCFFSNKS